MGNASELAVVKRFPFLESVSMMKQNASRVRSILHQGERFSLQLVNHSVSRTTILSLFLAWVEDLRNRLR